MSQPKVFEFAKEVGLEPLALMDKIKAWRLPVRSHMSTLDDNLVATIKSHLKMELEEAKGKPAAGAKKKVVRKKTTSAEPKDVAPPQMIRAVPVEALPKEVVETPGTRKVTTRAPGRPATAPKKSMVIRRRAGHEPDPADNLVSLDEEGGLTASAVVDAAANRTLDARGLDDTRDVANPAQDDGGSISADGAAAHSTSSDSDSAQSKAPRRNIVGRMDLSRVADPNANKGAATDPNRAGAARAGVGRNLRTGFVAPVAVEFSPQLSADEEAKRREERNKKKPGATREIDVKAFTATEFRKREVIFQPKKKRVAGINRDSKKTQITTPKATKRVVKMEKEISVQQLAMDMGIKAPGLIKKLIAEGVKATIHSNLDFDTVALIAPEFGFEVLNVYKSAQDMIQDWMDRQAENSAVEPRPPVVTVMGHVDHGKTTLLDSIRNARVAQGEAGGITQHIGAYQVNVSSGQLITFIDTPGHAAFTAMRARGANVTDIVIIVVAADDGMMPQTQEAISHAKAAGVPIIVAINKMDRAGANPDRIKQQLSDLELVPEDWGGNTIYCPVSALKGEGIEELLEQINLVAEMQELKAAPSRLGSGIVIESRMDKGRGSVATLLVRDGTVRVGDWLVMGTVAGRVRAMTNDRAQNVKLAPPGMPVEIIGLPVTPEAGDAFYVCENEQLAQEIAKKFAAEKAGEAQVLTRLTAEDILAKAQQAAVTELNLILKADVAGSLEAVKGVIATTGSSEVKAKLIHSGVGGITESDVLLAATARAHIYAFNVRPDGVATKLAQQKAVPIKVYSIIYELIDELKAALSGLLTPDQVQKDLGRAEVRETFVVPKVGTIAGCSVVDGKILRGAMARLVRDGRIIYEGKLSSLKRFKDDAKEVASGYECGIGIENYNDIKVGDVIEAFVTEEVAREL